MDDLIAAIREQTEAMRELAASNRAVVDMLLAQHADEDGGESPVRDYLDGSPSR